MFKVVPLLLNRSGAKCAVLFERVYCWVKFAAPEVRGKAKDKKDSKEDEEMGLSTSYSHAGFGFTKQYSTFTSETSLEKGPCPHPIRRKLYMATQVPKRIGFM